MHILTDFVHSMSSTQQIAAVVIVAVMALACVLRALANCRAAEENLRYERRALEAWEQAQREAEAARAAASVIDTLNLPVARLEERKR